MHAVAEIRFESVGEYVLCLAMSSDGTCLAVSEASLRRDAARGVRRTLQGASGIGTPDQLMQALTRECK